MTADVSFSGGDAGNYVANMIAKTTASIFVREATVSLEEPFYYIREMEPLPVFIAVFDDLVSGDAVNVTYTVLRDGDNVPYDQGSDESAGSYAVTPVASDGNYLFTAVGSILHVNPDGGRAVRPVLNCIEELAPGYYVANFEYQNPNDEVIFIPVGPDNLLTGTGIDWDNSDPQPTMFLPGGGTFRVFFDGSELRWFLSSQDKNKVVSNAANANSNSTKCGGGTKAAAVSTSAGEILAADPELKAYPNPVADKLYLTMEHIDRFEMILLYDLSGKSYHITTTVNRSDLLEVDVASLPAGPYYIRVVLEDTSMVVPVIKR